MRGGEVTSVEVASSYSDRPDDFSGARATIYDPSTDGILHEDARPPSFFAPTAASNDGASDRGLPLVRGGLALHSRFLPT